ncbi:hypothetical protein PoB_001459300 [Plakobranchus ocellatus]|uniref:Uncharacterized protein n=1 Tax=Plakobranchus ocellatus TaxID=259542 RepID=A0AAV3Z0P5_9GAST|nr:hypothetical protein PoB_001459300 [Plakobranchus ocellatus]
MSTRILNQWNMVEDGGYTASSGSKHGTSHHYMYNCTENALGKIEYFRRTLKFAFSPENAVYCKDNGQCLREFPKGMEQPSKQKRSR